MRVVRGLAARFGLAGRGVRVGAGDRVVGGALASAGYESPASAPGGKSKLNSARFISNSHSFAR